MEENETRQGFTDVRSKLLRHLQKDGLISEFPTIEEGQLIDSAAWFVWLRETGVLQK